VMNGLDLLYF